MEVVTKKFSELKPNPNNARIHSPEQIQVIINSINNVGFVSPVVIDEHNNVLAGHGRLLAMQTMGDASSVSCVVVRGRSEAEKRAYTLADNQSTLMATWDEFKLLNELEVLSDEGLDISGLGFGDLDTPACVDDNTELVDSTLKDSKVAKTCPYCGESL